MEEEITQVENPIEEVNNTDPENPTDGLDMSTDEIAAAMGYMTTLGEQGMQAEMAMEVPEEEQIMEEAPAEAVEEEVAEEQPDIMGAITSLSEEIKTLKKDIKSEVSGEISKIRKSIEDVVNEPEEEQA